MRGFPDLIRLENSSVYKGAFVICETVTGPVNSIVGVRYDLSYHPETGQAEGRLRLNTECQMPNDPSLDIPWFPMPRISGIWSATSSPAVELKAHVMAVHSAFEFPGDFPPPMGSTRLTSGTDRELALPIRKAPLNLTRELVPNGNIATTVTFRLEDSSCGDALRLQRDERSGDGGDAATYQIRLRADRPIERCQANLVAHEQQTQEDLLVTVVFVSVRDCFDAVPAQASTCGPHGQCRFDPEPFDGLFLGCRCEDGYVGPLCERAEVLVTWDIPAVLPDAFIGLPLEVSPGDSVTVYLEGHPVATTLVHAYQPGSAVPWGLRVDNATGSLRGTPVQSGIFSISILADAGAHGLVEVNSGAFQLTVADCNDTLSCNGGKCVDSEPFDGLSTCDCTTIGMTGSRCEVPQGELFTVAWTGLHDRLPVAVLNHPYAFSPPPEEVFTPSADGVAGYFGSGLPCGLQIDEASGEISGTPAVAGVYNVTILAESVATGTSAKVNGQSIVLAVVDCVGALSCNGGTCVDTVPMDGEFSCQCVDSEGTFCELSSRAAEQVVPVGLWVTGGVVGSIMLCTICVFAALWWRRRRAANRAFNFEETLHELQTAGFIRSAAGSGKPVEVARPREVKRRCVTILQDIGEGAFGVVHKGFLDEQASGGTPGYAVAIKVCCLPTPWCSTRSMNPVSHPSAHAPWWYSPPSGDTSFCIRRNV